MIQKMSIDEYLALPEDATRRELLWGMVHEPPAPTWDHQSAVLRVGVLLDQHVRANQLGHVGISPLDVVLDSHKALLLQPDVVFIAADQMKIVNKQVWGAPALVVEVESTRNRKYDRVTKLGWYREYGVREYWLIDPGVREITVLRLDDPKKVHRRTFRGARRVASTVLPGFAARVGAFFD